jgi:hypothetical protein
MKIVINRCFGGFSLSPRAVKRLAQLQGRDCFFYMREGHEYRPLSRVIEVEKKLDDEELENSFLLEAFDISDFHAQYKKIKGAKQNKFWEQHYLTTRPDDRTDPKLIQVVEELGEKANGQCAKLKIIEIPDTIQYDIEEYDGQESIHQRHASWR